MATRAHPAPIHPYNPTSSLSGPGTNTGSGPPIRYPSPFIPIRMPIFAVVIWLNDGIVWLLSVGGGPKSTVTKRPRGLSESSVVSVEEGNFDQNVEMKAFGSTMRGRPIQPILRSSRKKLDWITGVGDRPHTLHRLIEHKFIVTSMQTRWLTFNITIIISTRYKAV